MSQLWIPGARRVRATKPGVPFTTSSRRALWHTTEGTSIAGAVAAYKAAGSWPHVTWDPNSGDIVQHYPANVGSRALQNRPGGVETNSYGVLQVEVIGYARRPFTAGPMVGVEKILGWMRANGVPDVWPAGQPLAYGKDERRPGVTPAAYGLRNGTRSVTKWRRAGHFGHSQAPENEHGDPGRIDIRFTQEDDVALTDAEIKKIVEAVHARELDRYNALKREIAEAQAIARLPVDDDAIVERIVARLGELKFIPTSGGTP